LRGKCEVGLRLPLWATLGTRAREISRGRHATIDYSHRRPHVGGGRGQAVWQGHARQVGELPKIVRRGQGGRRGSVRAHPNLLPLLKNEILIRNPNSHVRSRHVFPSPCSESPLHRASVPCGPCPDLALVFVHTPSSPL
jgi:hypothetical protein